jgi:TrmH family RNA methyltransferase
MLLSRNKIKFLNSLKMKKFRSIHGQYVVEGDKIVRDILSHHPLAIQLLVATGEWLSCNPVNNRTGKMEIAEADGNDFSRISSLETPPEVMAVLDIPGTTVDHEVLNDSLTIALDNIRDPGNLGTIIRTADWFGISNILCSNSCADCYNPKVVQASMGALPNVRVHYTDLKDLFAKLSGSEDFAVYGTFLDGQPVFDIKPSRKGILVFGNESRGISDELLPFITSRITIPPRIASRHHVESLNVASAVAIICAVFVKN